MSEAIDRYTEQNPDVTIQLDLVPFPQHYQSLDTRLAAGKGPDIVRIQYQQLGHYSQQGALIDLSPYLSQNHQDEYLPNFWEAVTHEGAPYALPGDTGSHAIFYNTELFESLGIVVPDVMDEAWSWDDLIAAAQTLVNSGEVSHAFAMSWQPADNAYRWTAYLYQHGGRLLSDDLAGSAVNSQEAIEAIAFTQSWFDNGLVPPNTSIKSGTEIQTLFANGDIGMMINGDFQMSFLQENMASEWGVAHLVQDIDQVNILGGNGMGVTKDCAEPELAADFLQFLNNDENQLNRVLGSQLLPTRTELSGRSADELGYEYRPEVKDLFLEQLPLVSSTAVAETTSPQFGEINVVLGDELEAAFRSGQPADETAERLDGLITDVLA
ncbi:ABC transporter substrate-binding protein [Phytoactinopolyspora endophytica]|uniref:ABC transporter substrate-binding protein n=1 Tax=Phytoactinopolyspora endophytica TaxID=1642495 RepID=UPI0013EBD3A5|nr:sugar ABC transporter substrate-binding protein [Phytoactinopolyspora endophytica]